MKLTKKQFEIIRTSVVSMITGLVESMMCDTMDDYHRDRVLDSLDEDDFTDEEVDELRKMWMDVDKEGGIDDDLYKKFINEVVNSTMEKYK